MGRASYDPKMVMTTYEGWHNHDIPVARTITRNPAGTDGASIAHNDGERIKSEEDEAVSAGAAVGEKRAATTLVNQQSSKMASLRINVMQAGTLLQNARVN